MNTEQDQTQSPDESAGAAQQQQQEQPAERHGGQGADSALKQLHVWEQHRAAHTGGKRRQGPH